MDKKFARLNDFHQHLSTFTMLKLWSQLLLNWNLNKNINKCNKIKRMK
jgi:hypothetical protein